MKKLFLLSSISVFIGLMFLVFCTSQVYAQSPFGDPPIGGLPVCMEDLDLCNADLAASDGFIDNGDGTVTDVRSGLMWEKKDDNGGVHDKDNTYTWTDPSDGDSTNPDGTLFTVFLATLNDVVGGEANCFAGYCDWRIPEVGKEFDVILLHSSPELEAIVSLAHGACIGLGFDACISPVFGPTAAADYWSATSPSPGNLWGANLFGGSYTRRGI